MRKVTASGTELPRTAAVLKKNLSAVSAFHRGECLPSHRFGVCVPPCHAALGGTEPFLPMPGCLYQWSVALWAALRTCNLYRLGCFLSDRVAPAIGLDRVDRQAKYRSNMTVTGTGYPKLYDLLFLLLGHAFSPIQKAYWLLPPGDKRKIAGIRPPIRAQKRRHCDGGVKGLNGCR